MARKLPPLHLLQLFEAAGRNLSFKKAAAELFLTPSAISHQIKALEKNLDIELFKRLTRGVALTPAGKNYLAVVQKVFLTLDKGTTTLKQQFSSQSLRISTFSTIANSIIIPNLHLFQNQFPDIELNIETGSDMVDVRYDDIDLALRLGDGSWPEVTIKKMFDMQVTPLCSPEFAEQHQLTNIEQILSVPLIKLTSFGDSWSLWAEQVGINNFKVNKGLSLGSYDAVMLAAQQGLGLALGGIPLENFALDSKKLVMPFSEHSHFPQACYAVYRPQDEDRTDIHAFLNWFKNLIEQNDRTLKTCEHN